LEDALRKLRFNNPGQTVGRPLWLRRAGLAGLVAAVLAIGGAGAAVTPALAKVSTHIREEERLECRYVLNVGVVCEPRPVG